LIEIKYTEVQRVIAHANTRGVQITARDAWNYLYSRELLKSQPDHRCCEAAQNIIADFTEALATGQQLKSDSFAEFLLPDEFGDCKP
jgi:hypothetical protein